MNNRKYIKICLNILFVLYMAVAVYLLFFAESMGRTVHSGGYRYNLVPFKEIKRFVVWAMNSDAGFRSMIINIFGNIFFFTPLGFLYRLYVR